LTLDSKPKKVDLAMYVMEKLVVTAGFLILIAVLTVISFKVVDGAQGNATTTLTVLFMQ
jgi:hypothetical protein